jgi:hypothetical protein
MRRAFVISLGVAASLMFGAPAGASAQDGFPDGSPCSTIEIGPTGQGGTAGTENQVCMAGGVVNVGPSVGQVATITGPTITGPAAVGSVIVSAGNVAIG